MNQSTPVKSSKKIKTTHEEVAMTVTPKSQRRTSPRVQQSVENVFPLFVTPSPLARKTESKLQPTKPEGDIDDRSILSCYVPRYLHKNLDYCTQGIKIHSLSAGKIKAYNSILEHFDIPLIFDNDPKFGPKSGSCFEERVLVAFNLGLLHPKRNMPQAIT